jgi:hypothetical protein
MKHAFLGLALAGCIASCSSGESHSLDISSLGYGHADAPGLTCSDQDCFGRYAVGEQVTVRAVSDANARFTGWSGDCSGTGDCTLTMDRDVQATANFDFVDLGLSAGQANLVFMTSRKFAVGSLTVDSADAACNQVAQAVGLSGAYAAFWGPTTSQFNASFSRLSKARGWMRMDGLPFADSVQGLMGQQVFYPVRFDERGFPHDEDEFVAVGVEGISSPDADCSVPGSVVVIGMPTGGAFSWMDWGGAGDCSGSYPLYCFEVDHVQPVTPTKVQGRYAFVSTPIFNPGSGMSAADALCNQEAVAAGLPGSYLALLATTKDTAVSRFDTLGPPWVRPDGVPIALTAKLDSPAPLLASINLAADGTNLYGTLAMTGAYSLHIPGDAASTCSNWTNSSAAGAVVGRTSDTETAINASVLGYSCSNVSSVYCFQE